MPTANQFRVEHIAVPPRGWRVRTITPGPESDHEVRIAFPPGPRKRGAGKVVSIYHPVGENPRQCNPQAQTYLEAAKKAAESGDYIRTTKLLKKFASRKLKETTPGKHLFSKSNRKSNQSGAAKLYKDFHGRAPHEVIELQEKLVKAGDYTALGDNPELWLSPVKGDPEKWPAPDIEFEPKDGVKLASDAAGKQLYFIGGNQRLPLAYLKDFDTSKRFIALGTVYGISYLTEKVFDGFKSSTYAHELGEETGERPQLFYDKDNARMILAGGAYNIADVDASLKASPGIVN